jgi:hypothetical protein|tara:strand:+ start:619 stop:972 length:354 start_codon:yes stop_codon:yes gene_type:complete
MVIETESSEGNLRKNRIAELLKRATDYSLQGDIKNWFHCLKIVFSEVKNKTNKEEVEEGFDFINKVNLKLSNYMNRNPSMIGSIPTDPSNLILEFDFFIRSLVDKVGLKDDEGVGMI